MPIITCTVCGKRVMYNKGMHAATFVCYGCRNKHTIQAKPNTEGFFCISENKDGKKIQTCWLCDNQKATHIVEFNFIFKKDEYTKAETDKYFFYCCESCYKKYSKLEGKTVDVTKEPNFLNYRTEVQIEYMMQFVK